MNRSSLLSISRRLAACHATRCTSEFQSHVNPSLDRDRSGTDAYPSSPPHTPAPTTTHTHSVFLKKFCAALAGFVSYLYYISRSTPFSLSISLPHHQHPDDPLLTRHLPPPTHTHTRTHTHTAPPLHLQVYSSLDKRFKPLINAKKVGRAIWWREQKRQLEVFLARA